VHGTKREEESKHLSLFDEKKSRQQLWHLPEEVCNVCFISNEN
jgi:hypothetical protein